MAFQSHARFLSFSIFLLHQCFTHCHGNKSKSKNRLYMVGSFHQSQAPLLHLCFFQGLLNTYFDTWCTGSLSNHLPFAYNCSCWVTANDRLVFYTRAPAWKKFGTNVRLAHFTGLVKPWTHRKAADDDSITKALEILNSDTPSSGFTTAEQIGVLAYWWAVFFKYVKHLLHQGMVGCIQF